MLAANIEAINTISLFQIVATGTQDYLEPYSIWPCPYTISKNILLFTVKDAMFTAASQSNPVTSSNLCNTTYRNLLTQLLLCVVKRAA